MILGRAPRPALEGRTPRRRTPGGEGAALLAQGNQYPRAVVLSPTRRSGQSGPGPGGLTVGGAGPDDTRVRAMPAAAGSTEVGSACVHPRKRGARPASRVSLRGRGTNAFRTSVPAAPPPSPRASSLWGP